MEEHKKCGVCGELFIPIVQERRETCEACWSILPKVTKDTFVRQQILHKGKRIVKEIRKLL